MKKPKTTEDILSLNTKAQRNLSMKDLKAWYTQDELNALGFKEYPRNDSPILCNVKYKDNYMKLKDHIKTLNPKLLHRWTPSEDAFLKATYMYLSDQIIALALNLPAHAVKSRRDALRYWKKHVISVDVIVWDKRGNFEEDLQKEVLTKARPDILETLIHKEEES